MQYSHSKDKAETFSAEALARIEQEKLTPVPQNFELWYAYYAQSNTDVTRAIDVLVANKQKITDEKCEEIHQRFLNHLQESEHVRAAGDQVQDTIKDMAGQVSGIKSVTLKYNKTLEEAEKKLSSEADPEKMREALDSVLSDTHEMIEHNLQLEEELERSSAAMDELQKDLELVRKQALLDGLTNLANRKAFDEKMLSIIAGAEAEGTTFSLILMDIDHFKSFNDNYGHQVGDQVLRLVARTLVEGVKGRDLAARYGGEEFAIILPETSLAGGMKVADSLRKVVNGKELVNRNSGAVLGRITLSGGVAEYISGEDPENIIERVDTALYTAKHNGRNQIVAAPASPPKT